MTSLWDFALDFYARPGVSAACLTLQDEAGADVILLITAFYADHQGAPLDLAAISGLRQEMSEWREGVVLPLRAARRFLRGALEGHESERDELRIAVKSVELAAEKLQLALAANWLQRRRPAVGLPLREVICQIVQRPAAKIGQDVGIDEAISALLNGHGISTI